MAKQPRDIITFRLKPSIVERVDAIAETLGDSRGQVLERLILDALPGTERITTALENPIIREFVIKASNSSSLLKLAALLDGESLTEQDIIELRQRVELVTNNARKKSGKLRTAS